MSIKQQHAAESTPRINLLADDNWANYLIAIEDPATGTQIVAFLRDGVDPDRAEAIVQDLRSEVLHSIGGVPVE